MQTLTRKFEIKSLDEQGVFEGVLSPYDEVDEQSDCVCRGAFQKTISESGAIIPLLANHNPADMVGSLALTDAPRGLRVDGKLVLEVQKARECYALMKAGVLKHLSIGYKAIKSDVKDGVRYLREIRLFEGSLVGFPAAAGAVISSVKAADDREREALLALQTAGKDLKKFYSSLL